MLQPTERPDACFEAYRSDDEYDTEAITHVMVCISHVPGAFIADTACDRRGSAASRVQLT